MNEHDVNSLVTGRQTRNDPVLGGECSRCHRKVGCYFVLGGVGGTFLLHTHEAKREICSGSHHPRRGARELDIV